MMTNKQRDRAFLFGLVGRSKPEFDSERRWENGFDARALVPTDYVEGVRAGLNSREEA